jgi:hypothetical protein
MYESRDSLVDEIGGRGQVPDTGGTRGQVL